jgi:hypothetical protein
VLFINEANLLSSSQMTVSVSGTFDTTAIVENSEEATNCAVLLIYEANLISSPQMTISVSGKFDITAIV